MVPVLPIAGVLVLLVLFIVFIARHTRKVAQERLAALRAVAERCGWTFVDEVPFNTIPDLKRFELFRQGGRGRKLKNVMTSTAGDIRAVLFEYAYTVSTGKSHHVVQQTVFYATSAALDLPSFSLRPEHFLHTVATAFGYQDIDLEQRPTFSDMFLLRSDNEARTREVFADAVCEFFEPRAGVCAAGVGHELLYWRAGKLAKPDEIETMMADGLDLAHRFA